MRRCVKTIKQWSCSHGIAHSHVLRGKIYLCQPISWQDRHTYYGVLSGLLVAPIILDLTTLSGLNNFKIFAGVNILSEIDISCSRVFPPHWLWSKVLPLIGPGPHLLHFFCSLTRHWGRLKSKIRWFESRGERNARIDQSEPWVAISWPMRSSETEDSPTWPGGGSLQKQRATFVRGNISRSRQKYFIDILTYPPEISARH